MNFLLVSALLCTLGACLGHSAVQHLNAKSVSEKDTVLFTNTVNLDWKKTVETWYVPAWSKFYRYRTASEILGKEIEELTPNDLGVNSCLTFTKPKVISGFGHKVTFDINGTATAFNFKAPYAKAHEGEFKYELTDNINFILGVTTWEDGEKGWAILSKTPNLDYMQLGQILARAKSYGYSIKNAVFEDYSSCDM